MAIIESGIQMPAPSGSGMDVYGFGKMLVGDSMFFDGCTTSSKCMAAARMYGRYHGWKFTGRTVDGGLRIWRVE